MSTSVPISILILTKNEASNLPDCVASVAWSDDIHVLDSLSTDDTVSVATALGAHVVSHPFTGYSTQRNFGLSLVFKHAWVLILDADERMTPALSKEISEFVASVAAHVSAARFRRKDIWWGRWLKHAQLSPYYSRLVRVGKVHYEREVNEALIVDGDTADLAESFDHYPFSKGLDQWIERHNKYSNMEAAVVAQGLMVKPSIRMAVFSPDFNARRIHQKAIFYRMPFRPFIKLVYMLVYRRAFLDGLPGVRYSVLQMVYEYFIVLKTEEIRENAAAKKTI